jgi:hypothetical protein
LKAHKRKQTKNIKQNGKENIAKNPNERTKETIWRNSKASEKSQNYS